MLEHGFSIILILAGSFLSARLGKLTWWGSIAAAAVALLIYAGAGWNGLMLLGLFFAGSVWATAWQKEQKKIMTHHDWEQQRTAGQVLANGGVAALCGGLAFALPQQALWWQLGLAGALSSAMADTWSSELGTVYGRRFFDILTWQRGRRGDDGVISFEGLGIGLLASGLIASAFVLKHGLPYVWPIIIAGLIGNLLDSILGASLERLGILNNNLVNALNTLSGAVVAMVWLMLFIY